MQTRLPVVECAHKVDYSQAFDTIGTSNKSAVLHSETTAMEVEQQVRRASTYVQSYVSIKSKRNRREMNEGLLEDEVYAGHHIGTQKQPKDTACT